MPEEQVASLVQDDVPLMERAGLHLEEDEVGRRPCDREAPRAGSVDHWPQQDRAPATCREGAEERLEREGPWQLQLMEPRLAPLALLFQIHARASLLWRLAGPPQAHCRQRRLRG